MNRSNTLNTLEHSQSNLDRCTPHYSHSYRHHLLFALLLVLVAWTSACSGSTGLANSLKPAASNSPSPGSSAASPGGSTPSPVTSLTSPTSNLPTVNLLTFGSAGFGGDDTNLLQSALNTTAANGQALKIPAGTYNINPISFPANSQVLLDAGVTVQANPGYGPNDKMLTIKSQNVTIAGAGATAVVFKMRKSEYAAEHASDGSEYRHCLDLEGAGNVTISGISCNQSGGDGLYIGAGPQGQPSQNVTVTDCIFDQNFRQGWSLISGQHIFVYRSYFTNTSGTAPESGIDVEPNKPSNPVSDVHIEDSFTTGNAGSGLTFAFWLLDGSSQDVDITVLRHHSTSNQLSGYDADNNDVTPNAQGKVLVQDSFSDSNGSYGVLGHWYQADGPTLVFQNLSITNPHQNGPDPTYHDSAAVACMRGGGGGAPIGNIQFSGVNIAITNGKVDRYFNFADGSSKGVEKMVFAPGNLSGAAQVPPNGLIQSAGFNTVNQ